MALPVWVSCQCRRGGRVNCLACSRVLFGRLVSWQRAEGMDFGQKKLHLSLVDALGDSPGSTDAHVLGVTEIQVMRLAVFEIRATASDIRIVRGLPRVRFQAVAVHELSHVWLANQKALALPRWVSEGFCELVAYRFVSNFRSSDGAAERDRMLENPDPVYGEGFRKMKRTCDALGFPGLLTAIAGGTLGVGLS